MLTISPIGRKQIGQTMFASNGVFFAPLYSIPILIIVTFSHRIVMYVYTRARDGHPGLDYIF